MDAPLVVTVGDLVLDVTCRPGGAVRGGTDTPTRVVVDAGGQAANAAAWAVEAGAQGRLVTRRSADHVGRLAEQRIALRGVEVRGPVGATGGGAIVVLVRPDGERDMLSDRGASTELAAADLPADLLAGAGCRTTTRPAASTRTPPSTIRRPTASSSTTAASTAAETGSR